MANTIDTYADYVVMTSLISRNGQPLSFSFEDDVVTKMADFMFAYWSAGSVRKLNFPNLLEVCDGAFGTYVNRSYYTCEFDFSKIQKIGHFAFHEPDDSSSHYDVLYGCSQNLTINAHTIGFGAFAYCGSLVNVSLPNWEYMPSYFTQCCRATSSVFYDTTDYKHGVFAYCRNLVSVSAPKMVYDSKLMGAFYYCNSLTSISFPLLTKIASHMFEYCSAVTSLTDAMFPALTEIEDEYGCARMGLLSASLTNLVRIGRFGLCYNVSMTSVSFPNLTFIGTSAFMRCDSLSSVYAPKVVEIQSNAFNATVLTSLDFPELTTVHGTTSSGSFASMRNLVTAVLPKLHTVSETSAGIFYNDSALTTVDIGGDLNAIRGYMFYGCTVFDTLILRGVTGVVPLPTSSMSSSSSPWYRTPFASGGGTLYVPDALVDSYLADQSTGWKNFRNAGNQIKKLSLLPT